MLRTSALAAGATAAGLASAAVIALSGASAQAAQHPVTVTGAPVPVPTTTTTTTTTAAAPALARPPLKIITGTKAVGSGDIFVSPFGDPSQYANGAEILSPTGKEIWFHPAPYGQEDSDFRTQTLDGQPVLTFWQGVNFGGVSTGEDLIFNDHYQQIAAVNAGSGLSSDGHEFLITNQGDAWIISYTTSTADLTSIGGPADQTVINGVVQEIDIKTGKVLFSWNSANHVPYSQSEQPLPASASTPWDWFHLNAVKLTSDGNLLIDGRDTWTTYKVSRQTGNIIWQLGGKASSFTLKAGPGQSLNNAGDIFAWQHDPQQVGPNTYTVFDNESAGVANTGADSTSEFAFARVVTIQIDPSTRTATLIRSDNQPEQQVASSQGNGQFLAGGGEFIGWGILPYVSEFNAAGKLVFNAEYPTGVNTYRAYLLPWK